jgi:ubiquinone/menaquinone biosynthesis C-methylase UbiE
MNNVSQKDAFLNSEGDNWFERNLPTYDANKDLIPNQIQFMMKYIQPDHKVLEIGCATGRNLALIHSQIGCECYGIDPSKKAIEYGIENYPDLTLSVGTSDRLEFPQETFDFVLFGFCLYLVDRRFIMASIAEGDRVLKDKGFLGIIDFDAKVAKKRPYKHYEGIFSYKMDYSALFLAYPQYSMADKYCFSHSGDHFVEDVTERVSAVVLFKDQENAFILEPDF